MATPEQLQSGPEKSSEHLGEAAREQSERLQNRLEKAGELSPDRQAEVIEKARSEATREALMSKEAGQETKQSNYEDSAPAIRRVTKQQKEVEYKHTLSRVRTHLKTPSRLFSQVIHSPTVERLSDIGATTIARPNAILAGGISAFVLSGVVYFFARTIGYPLSGFETIGSFILGFIIGCCYDFLRTMITGKKS